jgi:hypothetical protein
MILEGRRSTLVSWRGGLTESRSSLQATCEAQLRHAEAYESSR